MAAKRKRERRRPADTFGARLALMRQASGGLNVAQAAGRCGIDDSSWRNWEAGKARPRDFIGACRQVSDGLDFDFEWVVLGGPLARSTGWLTAFDVAGRAA